MIGHSTGGPYQFFHGDMAARNLLWKKPAQSLPWLGNYQLPHPIAISGDVYVTTISESVVVTEALASKAAAHQALSESVAVSESLTVVAGAHVAISESVGVTDALAVTAGAVVPEAETVIVSENLAVAAAAIVPLAESVTITEALSVTAGAVVPISESVVVGESLNVAAGAVQALTETVTVSESLGVFAHAIVPISEGVTVGESLAVIAGSAVSLSETVTVAEALSVVAAALVAISEIVSVADALVVISPIPPIPPTPGPVGPQLPINIFIPGGGGGRPGGLDLFRFGRDDDDYIIKPEASDWLSGAKAKEEREGKRQQRPVVYNFASDIDPRSRQRIVTLLHEAERKGLWVERSDAYLRPDRGPLVTTRLEELLRGSTLVSLKTDLERADDVRVPLAKLGKSMNFRLVSFDSSQLVMVDNLTLKKRVSPLVWISLGVGIGFWMGTHRNRKRR